MFEPNQIICGAMPGATKELPNEFVNCSISSPPFWALRDYDIEPQIWGGDENCEHKWEGKRIIPAQTQWNTGGVFDPEKRKIIQGQKEIKGEFCSLCGAWCGCLGLEPTFELYIKHLCDIYDEVWRVLRKDGTCFVNLGDTYCGSTSETPSERENSPIAKGTVASQEQRSGRGKRTKAMYKSGIKSKSLCCIPERFKIEMINRGWICRNTIIWHKPNPMPSSAKDRFTVDFEYVFFFVKQQHYWFEPQYEPHESNTRTGRLIGGVESNQRYSKAEENGVTTGTRMGNSPLGRNKRTVWTIPTQSFSEAHFATFPEKLVEPMILSGCPEFVCKKCGMGRRKVYKPSEQYAQRLGKSWHDHKDDNSRGQRYTRDIAGPPCTAEYLFKGYTDCGCNAGWRPGIVLDLFCRELHYWKGGCKIAA